MAKNRDAVKASKPSKEDVGSKLIKSGKVGKPAAVTSKSAGKAKPAKATSDSDDSETSDSSASSASESDEESEEEQATKVDAKKANGHANGKAKPAKDESEDDSESSEEDSGSDEETPARPVKANGAKPANKKAEDNDDSEDDSSDESSDEEVKPVKATGETKVSAKAAKAPSDSGSDDSEEDSDDSDDSSEDDEEKEEKALPKKRKADEEAVQPAKKSRVDLIDSNVSPNLFVGNLSWNVDDIMLREHFESFGTIKSVQVMMDRNSGKSRGFGYIEFEDIADAKKAYEGMKDTEIDGRAINLDYAKPKTGGEGGRDNRRAQQYGDQLSDPSSTIFVGNISFEADEEMLSEAFSKYGNLTGVRLPTDPDTGSLKGYGYVEFSTIEEATEALNAMKGYNLAGRPLRLDFSTPRAGGGGRGNERRGGRGNRGSFNDRGRGGGRGRGGFNDRGGRGRGRGGFSTNRGGFGDYKGNRQTFD